MKTKDGDILNNFVKAPVDYHIRSWQEALTYYQIWPYFNSSLKEEILFVIYLPQNRRVEQKKGDALQMVDFMVVHNLTNPYIANPEERKIFVSRKKIKGNDLYLPPNRIVLFILYRQCNIIKEKLFF